MPYGLMKILFLCCLPYFGGLSKGSCWTAPGLIAGLAQIRFMIHHMHGELGVLSSDYRIMIQEMHEVVRDAGNSLKLEMVTRSGGCDAVHFARMHVVI